MNTVSSMVVYVEITLFCIACLVLIEIRLYTSMNRTIAQDSLQRLMWWFVCLFAVQSAWGLTHAGIRSLEGTPLSEDILQTLMYILLQICAYAWFLFDEKILQIRLSTTKSMRRILAIPAAAMVVLNLFNLRTGWLFTIDPFGRAQAGTLICLEYAVPFGYVIASQFLAWHEYRKKDATQHLLDSGARSAYMIPCFILAGVTMIIPEIPLMAASFTVCFVIYYLGSQDDSISVDALTHLNNRRQFVRYLSAKMREKRSAGLHLYLMIMDIDFFKKINDTYGHVAGDEALVRLADTLRKCSEGSHRRMQLSRYGGDEFIIVAEARGDEEIEALEDEIRRVLKEKNDEAKAPYELNISIGTAEYQKDMKDINDFLAVADAKLYEVKMEHHSRRASVEQAS